MSKDELPEDIEFTEDELEKIAEFKKAFVDIEKQLKGVFEDFNDLDINKYDFDGLNKMYDNAMRRVQQVQPGHVLFYEKKKK